MDRHSNDSFYITLPSNASLNVFKDNTSSHFKVDLPQHIDLEGPWEVALCEISYPHTWFTMPPGHNYYDWRQKEQEGSADFKRHHVTTGYYPGMGEFIEAMNTSLMGIKTGVHINYHPILKRINFQAGERYHLRFHNTLTHILGVVPDEWITFHKKWNGVAPYPADIKAGFYHLFCYSDVVRPQLVGDVFAPLLRTVTVKGSYGDVITQIFNPAHYLPVSKNHIENICVEIKSDQNEFVNFTFSKKIVKLHFRPCNSNKKFNNKE